VSEALMNVLATMVKDLPDVLSTSLREAAEARELIRVGTEDADLATIHGYLVHNRRMIERLEHLTATFVLMKSRTASAVAARRAAHDDAYVAAATAPSVSFGDYSSAKEKDAHYSLKTLDQQLALRKAEQSHRDVEAAHEYCRILLRGAEGVQRDLEQRIRLVSLTSRLEM
jgi:hypothetical protein